MQASFYTSKHMQVTPIEKIELKLSGNFVANVLQYLFAAILKRFAQFSFFYWLNEKISVFSQPR